LKEGEDINTNKMARKPLEKGNILNFEQDYGFYISRERGHIGRTYKTARQAYNLIMSTDDLIRTTREADKEIFEYMVFEKRYGRPSDDNIFTRPKA
jgi:hypothetical protein